MSAAPFISSTVHMLCSLPPNMMLQSSCICTFRREDISTCFVLACAALHQSEYTAEEGVAGWAALLPLQDERGAQAKGKPAQHFRGDHTMSIDACLFNAAVWMQLYMHDCKHIVFKEAIKTCSHWQGSGSNHWCCCQFALSLTFPTSGVVFRECMAQRLHSMRWHWIM